MLPACCKCGVDAQFKICAWMAVRRGTFAVAESLLSLRWWPLPVFMPGTPTGSMLVNDMPEGIIVCILEVPRILQVSGNLLGGLQPLAIRYEGQRHVNACKCTRPLQADITSWLCLVVGAHVGTRRDSSPAVTPADVQTFPSWTHRAFFCQAMVPTSPCAVAQAHAALFVVARFPLSMPAWAARAAPVQTVRTSGDASPGLGVAHSRIKFRIVAFATSCRVPMPPVANSSSVVLSPFFFKVMPYEGHSLLRAYKLLWLLYATFE